MSLDRELQAAVLDEFRWEPGITVAHIGVTAKDGSVTLTGHVPNYLEKRRAQKAAARVLGVKALADEIAVHPPGQWATTDRAIARAARDRLAWEVAVPAAAVQLHVAKGWVTLAGQVTWHYQREAAERVTRGLRGVVGIVNDITLTPSVDVHDLGQAIAQALHRSSFEPSTITASAVAGKVTLTGTVETLRDKRKAAVTAWASPGTTAVQNDLVVSG